MEGRQEIRTLTFADYELNRSSYQNTTLLRLDELVDWEAFRPKLSRCYTTDTGRRSYDPITMFKALIIQHIYSLSDRQLEDAICDRISFRRFLHLEVGADVPDFTTLCRFRNRLARKGLARKLLGELDRQLKLMGLRVKSGVMVDATLIESAARPPKKGAVSRDPDAAYTVKNSKPHFGYKAHIAVDVGTGLVRSVEVTPANVHDTNVFESLIPRGTRAVFADKAYADGGRKRRLRNAGVHCGILDKGYRNRPLSNRQRRRNRRNGRIRSGVERPFATLKRILRLGRAWYVGLDKVINQYIFAFMAINMRKLCISRP